MNNGMYFGNFGGGMIPNQQPVPRTGNWLTNEQVESLKKNNNQFKLSVTEEDLARGQCNHYTIDGKSALIPDQDGSGGCTCSICGTHFHPVELSYEQVEAATEQMLDIYNTMKIMNLSIDPVAAKEYFQIIPFLAKTPMFYKISCEDFKKYEGVNNFTPAMGGANPFNMFNTIMGGYNPAMMQQPMMNPMMQQPAMNTMGGYNPMMQQQPTMNPMMQQPMMNPMMQQQVNPMTTGYTAQQQGYVLNPTGAATPQQPQMVNTNMPIQGQAPQAPAAEAASETVKVEPTFKK